MYWTV